MKKQITSTIVVVLALILVGCEYPRPRRVYYAPPPRPPAVQPVSLADIKILAKSGVAEELILSQIRTTRTIYHLTTADILDLKDAGVSQKVIDFMINTPSLYISPPPRY